MDLRQSDPSKPRQYANLDSMVNDPNIAFTVRGYSGPLPGQRPAQQPMSSSTLPPLPQSPTRNRPSQQYQQQSYTSNQPPPLPSYSSSYSQPSYTRPSAYSPQPPPQHEQPLSRPLPPPKTSSQRVMTYNEYHAAQGRGAPIQTSSQYHGAKQVPPPSSYISTGQAAPVYSVSSPQSRPLPKPKPKPKPVGLAKTIKPHGAASPQHSEAYAAAAQKYPSFDQVDRQLERDTPTESVVVQCEQASKPPAKYSTAQAQARRSPSPGPPAINIRRTPSPGPGPAIDIKRTPSPSPSSSQPSIQIGGAVPSVVVPGGSHIVRPPIVSMNDSGPVRNPSVLSHKGSLSGVKCAGCGNTIAGRVVNAMGHRWHPDHFACAHCGENLEHVAFYEHGGSPYCHLDYHELFSPKCAYCNTPVEENVISALGKHYHQLHFFCRDCGDPFAGAGSNATIKPFIVEEGHPYCEKCHTKRFAPKCGGCKKPIVGGSGYVTALDKNWHEDCFVCGSCKKPFETMQFYTVDGMPYCHTCRKAELAKAL